MFLLSSLAFYSSAIAQSSKENFEIELRKIGLSHKSCLSRVEEKGIAKQKAIERAKIDPNKYDPVVKKTEFFEILRKNVCNANFICNERAADQYTSLIGSYPDVRIGVDSVVKRTQDAVKEQRKERILGSTCAGGLDIF